MNIIDFNNRSNIKTSKLHPQALDIQFRHRKEISRRFSDVLGLFNIDHLTILIANPIHEILFFSTTPSIEFNLISSDLWPHDRCSSPIYYKKNTFY